MESSINRKIGFLFLRSSIGCEDWMHIEYRFFHSFRTKTMGFLHFLPIFDDFPPLWKILSKNSQTLNKNLCSVCVKTIYGIYPEKTPDFASILMTNLLYDSGTRYDDWINQILHPTNGKTYQLVYHYKKSSPIRATRIGYYKAYPETWKRTDFATCSFSTAATIITWPSIEDVNEKMNKEYNHLRYRCNFVVDPVDNTPYQEDSWRKIR